MLAARIHGYLEVGTSQERIEGTGFQCSRLPATEAGPRQIQLVGLPGLDAVTELFRKAVRIRGHVERLVREHPRHLMLAVTVPGGAAEHRYDDLRAKTADGPHHVRENLLPGPLGERLVRGLGEPEVDGPGEELLAAVDGARRHQLVAADDAQPFPQLRADEILASLASRQRQIGGAHTHAAREGGDRVGVLVIRVRGDHQHPLDAVQLAQQEPHRNGAPVVGRRLGERGDGCRKDCGGEGGQQDNEGEKRKSTHLKTSFGHARLGDARNVATSTGGEKRTDSLTWRSSLHDEACLAA